MLISTYDKNGYFISKIELNEGDKCPITGEWLIPAGATDKEPTINEGYLQRFNGLEWEYEKILTAEEKKLNGILPLSEGEKIINNALQIVSSPGEFYSWNFDNFEWLYDESKKQAKINEINSKAYSDITAVYPEWKQMNITRMKDYNEETLAEYDKMIAFIDEIRAYADYEVMMLD